MCCEREEKFVIPTMPAVKMGWWVGIVLGTEGKFYKINLLWVERPENCGMEHITYSTKEYVREFSCATEAFDAMHNCQLART